MSKARVSDTKKRKKKIGRPATGQGTPIMVRLQPDLLKPLDQWIKDQPAPKPTRPDAVRKALQDWLTDLGLFKRASSPERPQAANEKSASLAARVVDVAMDDAAPAEENARRKRQVINGPKEFRGIRKDQRGHPKDS